MSVDNLNHIEAVKELCAEIFTLCNLNLDEMEEERKKNQGRGQNDPWYFRSRINASKLRRRSMDLTRALAELRKS